MDREFNPQHKHKPNFKNTLEIIRDVGEVDYGTFRVCEYPNCGTVLHHLNHEKELYCYVCHLKVIIENDTRHRKKDKKKIRKGKRNVQSNRKARKGKYKSEAPVDGGTEV